MYLVAAADSKINSALSAISFYCCCASGNGQKAWTAHQRHKRPNFHTKINFMEYYKDPIYKLPCRISALFRTSWTRSRN